MVSLCSAHLPRCTISKCFNSCKMSLSAAEQRQTTPRSRDQCSRVQRGGAARLNKLLPSSFFPLQSLHAWCFACSMSCTVGSPGTGGACGCGPPCLSVDCCLSFQLLPDSSVAETSGENMHACCCFTAALLYSECKLGRSTRHAPAGRAKMEANMYPAGVSWANI